MSFCFWIYSFWEELFCHELWVWHPLASIVAIFSVAFDVCIMQKKVISVSNIWKCISPENSIKWSILNCKSIRRTWSSFNYVVKILYNSQTYNNIVNLFKGWCHSALMMRSLMGYIILASMLTNQQKYLTYSLFMSLISALSHFSYVWLDLLDSMLWQPQVHHACLLEANLMLWMLNASCTILLHRK